MCHPEMEQSTWETAECNPLLLEITILAVMSNWHCVSFLLTARWVLRSFISLG